MIINKKDSKVYKFFKVTFVETVFVGIVFVGTVFVVSIISLRITTESLIFLAY